MDEGVVQEILHELFSSFERMETQSSAILQFMKDKGIATDEELAPYLESAGNASGVRWLAARVRIDYLISGAMKAEEEKSEQEKSEQAPPEASEKVQQSKPGEGTSSEQKSEKHRDQGAKPADAKSRADADAVSESDAPAGELSTAEKHQGQKVEKKNSPEKSAA